MSATLHRTVALVRLAASQAADALNDVALTREPAAVVAALHQAARAARRLLQLGRALTGMVEGRPKRRRRPAGPDPTPADASLDEALASAGAPVSPRAPAALPAACAPGRPVEIDGDARDPDPLAPPPRGPWGDA